GDQRSEVETHLRWRSFDLRVTARRIDNDSVQQLVPSMLRRGSVFARAAALLPISSRLRLRLTAFSAAEDARGISWTFSRRDAGVRAGAVLQLPHELTLEGGEAVSGGTFWGDKTYLMLRWAPSAQVHLRFLYSKQFFTGGFAGMNGELGVS